jgi:hypothetical protein
MSLQMSEPELAGLRDESLRRRLRRRAMRQAFYAELRPECCERLMFDDKVADEVLRRLGEQMEGQTLWERILSIPWLELAQIILSVIAMFGEAEEETV